MGKRNGKKARELKGLAKVPTGIQGLDEITGGGLPQGRPTLVCGGAGCGKTLLGMQFLVNGATEFDEPGVFMSFEETADELGRNVASLGFDLEDLQAQERLYIDHVRIERSEIEETGAYDLEGLFIRLQAGIDAVGARRVVLDTIEALFSGFSNDGLLRAELRRLFRWLKDRGLTTVITGERGHGVLTRHGLEEYVSDCVILLDFRVNEQIATRRLRIVKYRGSMHGTNEYPFIIDEKGLSVLPITSLTLDHAISTERVSMGVPSLDEMLDGGFYRGSTILVSGSAGSGKTSLAAHFAEASGRRQERCLYLSFEESPAQIIRNMRSIGIDLAPWVQQGLLQFHNARSTLLGLESHLVTIHKAICDFGPRVVVVDPINSLTNVGSELEVRATLERLIDFLKSGGITALFTSLIASGHTIDQSDVNVSSLIDSWISVRNLESEGERNRGLYVLKARGLAHSNQVREFLITGDGVRLIDVAVGRDGVLTGSKRLARELQEKVQAEERQRDGERRQRALEHRRRAVEAEIARLRAEFEAEADRVQHDIAQDRDAALSVVGERRKLAQARQRRGEAS